MHGEGGKAHLNLVEAIQGKRLLPERKNEPVPNSLIA
jgi:hypothetical protein